MAVLGVDLMAHLRQGAQTADALAGLLKAPRSEIDARLDALVSQEWVKGGGAGYASASSWAGIYQLTPKGEEAYGSLLDRWSLSLTGPPSMSVVERFLLALRERWGEGSAQAIGTFLDRDGVSRADEVDERERATILVRTAIGWLKRALEQEDASSPGALGLASLPLASLDEIAYAAKKIRSDYAGDLRGEDARAGAAAVVLAAEALWEARPMEQEQNGIWQERQVDFQSLLDAADAAAAALAHFGLVGAAEPLAEGEQIVEAAPRKVTSHSSLKTHKVNRDRHHRAYDRLLERRSNRAEEHPKTFDLNCDRSDSDRPLPRRGSE